MKLPILFLSGICLFLSSFAAEPAEIDSRITGVTVYLRFAQVTREGSVNIPKGTSSLVFRNLPANIDAQSIQVKGEGDFTILSMVHQINYLKSRKMNAELKMLEDSLKIYQDRLAWIVGLKDVLSGEQKMLIANQQIGSNEKGVILSELKLAVEYYRNRLSEIKKEEIKLNRQEIDLKDQIQRVQNQIEAANQKFQQPTSEVIVNVSSDQVTKGNIVITYTVFDAGWIPAYDARVKDIKSPVHLFYNARVYQNSGEDWDKVHVKLSTANPQQKGEKPDLQPWFLDFQQPIIYTREYNAIQVSEDMEVAAKAAPEPESRAAGTTADYVVVDENQTNLEFNISIPYDIPSDNQQYTINIQDFNLPAFYEYYCAPKLDREAFLLARITGWEDYNLLSGEMNLFFEDTYVGKSQLNVRNTKDTLDLSLGRDKNIIVTRVKMKDFTEQKTIGANKRETRAWEITVRNNKKQAIDLRIEDQVPVSMNKDLEIETLDISGGKINKETGLISWKQKIEPSAEKKLRVSYAVKYPKDKVVYID